MTSPQQELHLRLVGCYQFRDFNDTIGNTRSVQDPWYNVNTGEILASEGLGQRFEISYITIICITGTTE